MRIRNRFNSVALSHRLAGFIPWFLRPKRNNGLDSNKCSFSIDCSVKPKPTKYISRARIFIHGLERTGTGYCSRLLEENIYHISVNQTNKHNFFAGTDDPSPYERHSDLVRHVICTKHPYSWFLSYKKYHEVNCHNGNIPGIDALTHYCEAEAYEKYIITYNKLYNHWIEACSENNSIYIARYEDLLQYPEESIKMICSRFDLYKNRTFINPSQYYNNYSRNETDDGKFSRKKYYLKKEYMHDLSPEHRHRINSIIDRRLVNLLGYDLEI
jgi:hypothetical protein